MLTSKQRAQLRAQANTIDTTLMVGKSGVTEQVIAEAENLLESAEIVKGKVLETAFASPREVSDAICEATGADGVQVVGTKFVIYRKSKKLEQQRQAAAQKKKAVNPVRAGAQARRKRAKAEREQKQKYFHDAAVKAAIEKRKTER